MYARFTRVLILTALGRTNSLFWLFFWVSRRLRMDFALSCIPCPEQFSPEGTSLLLFSSLSTAVGALPNAEGWMCAEPGPPRLGKAYRAHGVLLCRHGVALLAASTGPLGVSGGH